MKTLKATEDYNIDFRNKVHLYYSNQGKIFRQNLKINVSEKNKPENAQKIDTQVKHLKELIRDYNIKYLKNPPVSYIKEKILIKTLNKTDILSLYDSFLNEMKVTKKSSSESKRRIKPQSIVAYETFKGNIEDFINKNNYLSIDQKFIDDFISFLSSDYFSYSYSSLCIKILYLKVFMKYLKKKDIIKFVPEIQGVEKLVTNKNVETLTKDELNFLISERNKDTEYKTALNYFLFQCFTSVRYSDLLQISANKIQNNRITIISKKTGSKLTIFLNDTLNTILSECDYSFNKYTYKQYRVILNKMLKSYAEDENKLPSLNKDVEFEYQNGTELIIKNKKRHQLMGSHTGRRVFITIQIILGTPFPDIMKMTGHKSLDILQEYLDIYNQEKGEIINNITDKMVTYLQS